MSNPNTRKSCVVPKCKNTTTNAPEKLFFIVPKDIKMRQRWIKAMKRLYSFGDKSVVYCCEDHFDIENDMENYIKYKLVGGRIKLKKGVVPHKFTCQQKKNDNPERSAIENSNELKYFEKLSKEDKKPKPIPSTLDTAEESEVFLACVKEETVIEEDPLSLENGDQCLEISKKHKAVQVHLKDNVIDKSTMTEEIYFKKAKKKRLA